MGFIEDYMEMTKEQESPRNYFYWSSLCVLSAVKKREVWIERYAFKTYPNIYVMLVGESGLRKGVPISLSKDLVAEINNTRLISGRSSVQGIISALGTAYTLPDGKVISKAYGYISSSEFASSIVRDPDALTILTDLFDSCYNDKWVDTLRSGRVELIEPSITMLAGINPALFEDFINPSAISGGFVGRLFLVFENKKANVNSLLSPPDIKYDKEKLVRQLKDIDKVKGPMTLTTEARELYETWYHEFEKHREVHQTRDKTGSINRVGENILKIVILISLSRSPDNEISLQDMRRSIDVCTTSLGNVNKTTVAQGKSQFAPQTKLVITELIAADKHELSRRKVLSQNYGAIDAVDLDRVVDSLSQAGALVQFRKGTEIWYKLTDTAIKQIEGMK